MSGAKSVDKLSSSFLLADPKWLSEDGLDVELLERCLRETVRSAEQAWPSIQLAPHDYVAYLSSRVAADAQPPRAAIEALYTDCLYLACACARGVAGAIETFESLYSPTISRTLQRFDSSGALADEAMQILRERLFVGNADKTARIFDYGGHGQLRRWVRAIATRIGLDLVRETALERRRHVDKDILASLPDASEDPELAHLRASYSREFKQAFESALAALPSKQRTILRYHLVDGLNIDQIGSIYQVHRTTAFRWLRRARETLIEQTREVLRLAVGVPSAELDSLLRLVDSHVDLSLHRLLEPSRS